VKVLEWDWWSSTVVTTTTTTTPYCTDEGGIAARFCTHIWEVFTSNLSWYTAHPG
jgi:hypothetical protein